MGSPGPIQVHQLKPCLAELLRTCVHPTTLLLKVEHVSWKLYHDGHVVRYPDGTLTSENHFQLPATHCLQLALSDGHLQVQAVIAPHLLNGEVPECGDLVEVRKYQVRKARRQNRSGKVVYLGIQDCRWFQNQEFYDSGLEGGFFREGDDIGSRKRRREHEEYERVSNIPKYGLPDMKSKAEIESPSPAAKRQFMQTELEVAQNDVAVPSVRLDESSDDDFENFGVPVATVRKRRQALRLIQSKSATTPLSTVKSKFRSPVKTFGNSPSPSTSPVRTFALESHEIIGDGLPLAKKLGETEKTTGASCAQAPSFEYTVQPPLHTLRSLLTDSTLPSRSYICSVFGVISWVSSGIIAKPNAPFPPKRHLKIHDPTIATRKAGITVAVYVDAQNFYPELGTVALFKGVTMQKWEGEVILNAYPALRDRPPGEEWFVNDHDRLKTLGHDVAGLTEWWTLRVQSKR